MKSNRRIAQWSYSRWSTYERCPRMARYKFVDRLPEGERGPALLRGETVHRLAERYVKKEIARVPAELRPVAAELRELRRKGAKTEIELAITKTWRPTGWFDPDAWARAKIDVALREGSVVSVIDYKTGRYQPGAEEHRLQLELYGAFVLSCDDEVEEVRARLLFVDHGRDASHAFHRNEVGQLRKLWDRRVRPLLRDATFPTRPGGHCRWCPYSKARRGPCEF